MRLASMWLALLMLATTTFATTAFAADEGTKTEIRFFFSYDEDDYLQEGDYVGGIYRTLPLTEGKVKLSDFIDHENSSLALNVNPDFKVIGWLLWETDPETGKCGPNVNDYSLDHEFVATDFPEKQAGENTYTRIVEPMLLRVGLTGTVLVLSCEDDILSTPDKYLSSYNSSNRIKRDFMADSLSLADDEVTTMAGEPPKGKFLDGWQLWSFYSSGYIRLSGEEPIAEYEVDGEITASDMEKLYNAWGALAPVLADYAITHQPTDDEPFVETNKDEDVASYTWYQVAPESNILVDGEDEYKLSGGEGGEEYYVEIEFEDGTVLTSDRFEWKTPQTPPNKTGGGGMPAGGDMSTTGADKYDDNDQTKPEDSTPTTPTTPSVPSGEQQSNKLFDDVPVGSWFEASAEWMGQKGYMSGTAARTFSPNLNTTRGMIVTVLWRMAGSPAPTGECPFEDVKADSYYEDAITWAQENGVVTGHSETVFAPDDLITREQLATIIFRNEVRKGMEAITMEENLSHFADADKVSEYAVTAMNWAVGQKIINGVTDTLLAPQKEATRAECATMLYRMENK